MSIKGRYQYRRRFMGESLLGETPHRTSWTIHLIKSYPILQAEGSVCAYPRLPASTQLFYRFPPTLNCALFGGSPSVDGVVRC
jgi:hypothetical protein